MKRKPCGSATGQILPVEILNIELRRPVAAMEIGAYGWATVWADENNRAFVFADDIIRDGQGEFWPHFLTRHEDGYRARLMTQRVNRLYGDVAKSTAVLPVIEVEL